MILVTITNCFSSGLGHQFWNWFFGSDGLKEKAKKAFNCECECTCCAENWGHWQTILENDENDSIKSNEKFDLGMDLLDWMQLDTPLQKLPIRLDLMVYNELAKWLRPQIVQSRKERGFSGTKIVYKDPSWCPPFWPHYCDWMEVSNFSRWNSAEYTGPGDLTDVLRQAVENRLQEKGIEDPDSHIVSNRDEKKEKRKEKCRGRHSNPLV